MRQENQMDRDRKSDPAFVGVEQTAGIRGLCRKQMRDLKKRTISDTVFTSWNTWSSGASSKQHEW